jgi:predicted transcriptional regulator
MLITEGPKPATEIQRRIGKTREHAARLMRKLYDQGLVLREEDKRPYIYTVSDKVRELMREPAGEGKASETANQQD